MSINICRGDVRQCWLTEKEAGIGCEMRVVWKDRFVVVVSADEWNLKPRNQLVSIVPLTSLRQGRTPRWDETVLESSETGLPVKSVTSSNQHLSVDRLRLGRRIGQVPELKMREITNCLAAVFGIELPR
jgi:mRNA-degrading endonuclease toxin of MazEF toxin-antitoxin module